MALTITVEITDEQQACLEHFLLDVDDWIQKATLGKINNCKKRMALEASAALKADPAVDAMPASDAGLVAAFVSRPGYLNRKGRAEEEAVRARAALVRG